MRKRLRYLLAVGGIVLILSTLFLCWIAAYYVTDALYSRMAWEPHGLAAFLVNAVLGFFFFGIVMSIFGKFIRARERKLFTEMMDALKRISRGDFHVNLDFGMEHNHQRRKHPFVQLVDGINDMAANLKEMEDLRQEFISNVSHEIGTPLTAIGGFAKALKDESLEQEQKLRYLDIIETECTRLSKLSDNLMKLAVLDSSRHPFHPVRYRLDKQLVSIILACEPLWEEKQIDMNVESIEVLVTADEELMSQAWANLIHNAIKFTPPGGIIWVSVSKQEDHASVSVKDTGPGIAEEDQPRIFERFYKADKSRTRAGEGSGLGLSIVKKIIEMHDGTITIYSKGEGTEFIVTVPCC